MDKLCCLKACSTSCRSCCRTHSARGTMLHTTVLTHSSGCLLRGRAAGLVSKRPLTHARLHGRRQAQRKATVHAQAAIDALIFDCDGVILESEGLHREAYNAAFEHFQLQIQGDSVSWSEAFYDELQNKIGGGKGKMRWYFREKGWPASSILDQPPSSEEEQAKLIDELQAWKSEKYRDFVGGGSVEARPGVIRLMDEAHGEGVKLAVCSAATRESVVFCIESLLGRERYERLDAFLAGDDVPSKKPDPAIYKIAAERLGVKPADCLVIEDSKIGLEAARGAGMPCLVTYTSSTETQDFDGAARVVSSLDQVTLKDLLDGRGIKDDRADRGVQDSGSARPESLSV